VGVIKVRISVLFIFIPPPSPARGEGVFGGKKIIIPLLGSRDKHPDIRREIAF